MMGLICKIEDWAYGLQEICYPGNFFFRIVRENCLENCLKRSGEKELSRDLQRKQIREKECRTERKQAGKLSPAQSIGC